MPLRVYKKGRMSFYNRCERCRINADHCICKNLKDVKTKTFVTLITHQKEFFLPSNTGFIYDKVCGDQSEILIRGIKEKPLDLNTQLTFKAPPLILYPTEDASEVNDDWVVENPGPFHLIVPDGNWTQARKIVKRETKLNEIPAVVVKTQRSSSYLLRTQEHENQLCTMEAIIEFLKYFEDSSVIEQLENNFQLFNSTMFKLRSGGA